MKVAQLVFIYRTHTDLVFHGFYLEKCIDLIEGFRAIRVSRVERATPPPARPELPSDYSLLYRSKMGRNDKGRPNYVKLLKDIGIYVSKCRCTKINVF